MGRTTHGAGMQAGRESHRIHALHNPSHLGTFVSYGLLPVLLKTAFNRILGVFTWPTPRLIIHQPAATFCETWR